MSFGKSLDVQGGLDYFEMPQLQTDAYINENSSSELDQGLFGYPRGKLRSHHYIRPDGMFILQ